jgi:hypothetical protein
MALHYDPIYDLVWTDQPGKQMPDQDTLWQFPLDPRFHNEDTVTAVRESIAAVKEKRALVFASLHARNAWDQMRELLEPIIKRAVWQATRGAEAEARTLNGVAA